MRIDVTVAGAGGERDVALHVPDGASVADVAGLLGVPPLEAAVGFPALAAGMRLGTARAARRAQAPGHRLTVVGGPGTGRSVRLDAAPLVVGRARGCDLSLPDPRLSRRHLAVRMGPRGPVLRDLASANGTSIDGRPLDGDWHGVRTGQLVRAADTFLAFGSGAARALPIRPGPDGLGLVAPAPSRDTDARPAAAVELPAPPTFPERTPIQWLAVLAPAVAGVVLAALLGAWTFLLLAVLSPVAVLAGGIGERWRGRRSRRRMRADHARASAGAQALVRAGLRAEARRRRLDDPDPAEVAQTAAAPGLRLWERRPGSAGMLRARMGLADAESQLQVVDAGAARPAGTVPAVPRCVDLAVPLALRGPLGPCRAVGRWLVGQLATFVSPAELEVVLIADEAAEVTWRWLRWLPHWQRRTAIGAAEQQALLEELAAERRGREPPGRRTTLVVVDGSAQPARVTALLDGGCDAGLTAIWIDRGDGAATCPLSAAIDDELGTRLRLPDGAAVVADQVDEQWADALARSLAPLRPDRTDAASLPPSVRLLDLVPDAADWGDHGTGLPFVLGSAAAGPLVIDLVRDGPHALVAGTTGAGKSELLRTMVAALALAHPPDRLAFVLVDYKGGAAFAECARLPHTAGCVTDLDGHLTARALRSLERELRRREALLAEAGVADLAAYPAAHGAPSIPRLVIVVDEFAALAEELPDFVTGLVGIAQRGRSLGIHLVLATQRPSGVVSPEVRANASLRIALRVTDAADSRDVVDCGDAAVLERRTPGRAVVRVAGGDVVPFQTAAVSMPPAPADGVVRLVDLDAWRRPREPDEPVGAGSDLDGIVRRLTAAAAVRGVPRPQPPWLPPLPEMVDATSLSAAGTGVPVALADVPDEQAQHPLTVDLAGGCGVVIAGCARSGRTSALLALALQAAGRYPPDELEISVVDFGAGLRPLTGLPHTGSLVSDGTGARALLRKLTSARGAATRHLLLLDGFEQFVAAVEHLDGGETIDALLGLLRSAPSTRTTVAVAGDRAVLQPRVAGAAGLRLALRLADPADYALAGLAAKAMPRRLPPGRAVTCPEGVEVQVAAPPADAAAAVRTLAQRWPAPVRNRIVVRPLPEAVRLADLTPVPGRLILGLGGDAAEPLDVDPFAGAGRLLVCGPPASGRSTLLCALRAQAAGHGWGVAIAAPPRSPMGVEVPEITTAAPDERLLVLVDDAEDLLDTAAESRLLALLAERERDGGATALVVATTSEQAAVGFRGLIAEARRSRCLVLLHPGPADAALLDARPPRPSAPPPPGRGVVVGSRHWGPAFASGPLPLQVAAVSPCGGSGGRWAG